MATRAVAELQGNNCEFATFLLVSLRKYISCDWGDVCTEDWESNDEAVRNGERILAAYKHGEHPEWRIWIITEWDRSVTTILFPDEY